MNEATRLYHRIRAMVLRDINAALAGRNTAGGATATVVEGHSHDDRYPLESELDAHVAATGVSVHGLGSISTQSSAGVNITGGNIAGITDLAVADGGTGASTASGARTNLGLVIGTNVQAWDADLDAIAALAKTDGNIIVGNGSTWVAESGSTARTSLGLGTGDSPQFTAINLGHASDTTIARVSAGLISVEGVTVTLNTATQTLTNKTLTAPVIATIVNTGTLTLPTSTDTLVGRATTDTLTNKTYSGGTNSGTQAGDHTLSGAVTFSNATSPIIAAKLGPASGQQHTLPAVTSDTIALLAATQTLTNKTLTNPTIASFVNAQHNHSNAAGGGTIAHSVLIGIGANDHHNQSHVLASTSGLGADHTVSGLTARQVLRATSATTAAFGAIEDADIPSTIVRTSRTLTAGAGLTGGGDLTANRTFNVGAGAGLTVNADDVALTTPGTLTASTSNSSSGNHTHAITTGAATTLSVSTSNGAGSSASLARADHLHTITSSSNPGAAASLLASDSSGFLTLVKLNTDTLADKSGGNLTISPAGDVIFDPTGNDLLPASNYDLNIGSLSKKYLTLHAAELWVETLVAQDTIATIGGRILVGPTTTLTRDLTTGATTIYVKHNEMASGDRAYMEANGKVEFFAITSSATEITPNVEYSYTVTRNLDGTGANQWYAGDAIFNTGTTGDGFIDLYSLRSVKSATQYGPAIVGNVRNSSTYNDWTEHWAIGNLNGVYGYGATTYGFAAGKYASGQPWVAVDATNGFRVMRHTTQMAQWDTSGNITVGQVASGQSNVYISSGAVKLRNNTTDVITLLATANANGQIATFDGAIGISTSGGIYQGTGTFSSPTTGLKLWNDSGVGRIGGYNGGAIQWYGATDGKLYAGAGAVVLDSAGMVISGDGLGWIVWKSGSTTTGQIYSNRASTTNTIGLNAVNATSAGSIRIAGSVKDNGDSWIELAEDAVSNNFKGVFIGKVGGEPTAMLDVYGDGKFSGSLTAVQVNVDNLRLADTNASHDLIIASGSDLTADRTLTLVTGDAGRTLTLTGNATLNDWFDQAVKVASSPTFAGGKFTGRADFGPGGDTVNNALDDAVFGSTSGTGNGVTILTNTTSIGYVGFQDTSGLTPQGFVAYDHNIDALLFRANTSEKQRILANGNVLIGTTTDSGYKLDVTGALRATGAAYLTDIRPVSDSTTALQWKRSGGTAVVTVDTTNSRMGINKTPGSYDLDVNGGMYVGGGTRLNGNVGIADNPGSWALKVNGDASAVRIGLGTDPNPSYRIDAAGNIKIGGDIWATGSLDVNGNILPTGYVARSRVTNQGVSSGAAHNTGVVTGTPSQWLVHVIMALSSGSGLLESASWLVTRLSTSTSAQLLGGSNTYHSITMSGSYEIQIQNDDSVTRYISVAILQVL